MDTLLVLLDTDGSRPLESSRPAIRFAQGLAAEWKADFDVLLLGGPEIAAHSIAWQGHGARTVWCVGASELAHPTADRVAFVCRQIMEKSGSSTLIGTASTFGKDVLPRVAEAAALPMISDTIAIAADCAGLHFLRPMFAGNIVATVEIETRSAVFSVRSSAFGDPRNDFPPSEVKSAAFDSSAYPSGTQWVSMEAPERSRPDLTAAHAVVSGGRPLRDAETFEKLIGGLADVLHGAVGATRAAVDSGIAPNELQVGQTGKVVAPDLYIAAGISGSVQHLAGMKDSRVIVAINTDPDAPIFEVADFGLVADLHQAVPELMQALKASMQK